MGEDGAGGGGDEASWSGGGDDPVGDTTQFLQTGSLQDVTEVCATVTNVVVVLVNTSPTHFFLEHSLNTASSFTGCKTSLVLLGPVFTTDLWNLRLAQDLPSVLTSLSSVTIAPFFGTTNNLTSLANSLTVSHYLLSSI